MQANVNGFETSSSQPFTFSSASLSNTDPPHKRHMEEHWVNTVLDGAPFPKKKMDKVAARLDKVHLSPEVSPHHTNWRKRHYRPETFDEIEHRLSDSSDGDVSSEDDEPSSSKKERVEGEKQSLQLSDELREYIKRSLEHSKLIPNPSLLSAVVPYVPRGTAGCDSMQNRINEIDEDDREWNNLPLSDGGRVTTPDDNSSSDESSGAEGTRDAYKWYGLNIVEIEDIPEDNCDADMDCS